MSVINVKQVKMKRDIDDTQHVDTKTFPTQKSSQMTVKSFYGIKKGYTIPGDIYNCRELLSDLHI